jgi:Holliday junction resolvase
MANNIPFQPMGNCVVAVAASANTQGNVVSITAISPVNQYLVFNTSKDYPVFVAYGQTSDITATIPTSSGAPVVAVPPYTEKVFTGPQVSQTKTVYVRIIAPHNNAELYITPGEGL